MRIYNLTIVMFCCCLVTSCLNDKVEDIIPDCDSTYFVKTIKPIYLTNCYDPDGTGGCHNGSSGIGNFSIYNAQQNGIKAKVFDMPRRLNLPPSDPDHMPRGHILPAADLEKLNKWLDAGSTYCN